MRTSALIFATAASLAGVLLITPAQAGDTASEWRQVTYSCESGLPLTVSYRESGSAVQVAAADKKAVKLVARPAKAGFRYGDSRHELRGEGEVVTWQIGSKTPVRCTTADPAVANFTAAALR